MLKYLVFCCLLGASLGAVPHNHGVNKGHGEREADGAFSPRDHGHMSKDGEHDHSFDHEAILGSSKDAEEYDGLPPEEAKRRLAILLKKMDLNQDQQISPKELKQWILRSFKALSEEESTERFTDTDLNEDGAVTWQEYLSEEFDLGENDFEEEMNKLKEDPNRSDEVNMMAEDRVLFQSADKNGDDKLDSAEFLSFSHPEEVDSMHDTVVAQVLKEKDVNQDGKIQFQEYVGDRGKDQNKEWLVVEKDRFDQELDANHDGALDRGEILAWMIPSNDDIADDEVKHLFAGADDDVDEILTFEEILEHHDLFVGSEATDYGEHLENLHKFGDEL